MKVNQSSPYSTSQDTNLPRSPSPQQETTDGSSPTDKSLPKPPAKGAASYPVAHEAYRTLTVERVEKECRWDDEASLGTGGDIFKGIFLLREKKQKIHIAIIEEKGKSQFHDGWAVSTRPGSVGERILKLR